MNDSSSGSNRTAYARSQRTAWRTIGDQTIVIALDTQRMMGFNPMAAWVWACLATPVRVADLTSRLESAEPGAPDTVAAFVAELTALGLAGPAEPDATAPATPEPPTPFERPAILWQQPLRAAAFTCAHIGGQSGACDATPTT